MSRSRVPLAALTALLLIPASASAATVVSRDTEPVVLTGKDLGEWAAPANVTARLPLMDVADCPPKVDPAKVRPPTDGGASGLTDAIDQNACPEGYDPHSHYAPPQADTAPATPAGVAINRLLGYRWDGHAFVQIPFQVDEVFTRYLDNTASGFSAYSGEDQHTTYAYDGPGDREGFRYTKDGPAGDPCRATAASPAASDPVKGLDGNDEIAFMYRDAAGRAPATAALPRGIEAAKLIAVADPASTSAPQRYVYVMRTVEGKGAAKPAFNARNGYVRYGRDADAGRFVFSQSSYDSYGNAPKGVYCDARGRVVRNADGTPRIGQRRPLDTATIATKRYIFRYDGRWLMTQIRISPDNGKSFGPDLVDRFKARAFAQDPASETPCCGYEEEDTNWGGSSILLGERVGPVRAIRETWGADSGTNVIRRETFYRDEMNQKTWLRVHVIPPADGIYAQWDFNAGRVDRFYNTKHASGVPIDGRNDEAYGNLDDPCNDNYDANDTSSFDQGYRQLYRSLQACNFPYHLSADPSDPTFGEANAALGWSEVTGASGTIVDRISTNATDVSPGGSAQSLLAVPYYRDDSCFDDGTGSDPGPKLHLRSGDEPRTTAAGTPRKCWHPGDGIPTGSDRFFQGSIATHGVHILAIADSDNARQTVPLTEITSNWRMVMLPGRRDASAGEAYGHGFEQPLVAVARPSALPGE